MAKHEEFLKQVKERAEAATPGPWHCAGGIYVYSTDEMVADNNDETALIRARGVGGGMSREQQEANVEFVAAANPQAVLKLLDRLERYEKALRVYADPEFAEASDNHGWGDISKATDDSGKIAREALEGDK